MNFLPVKEWIQKYREKREFQQINSMIEKEIRKEKHAKQKQYKILLLGAGGSGKSTFVKQMKILYGIGFSDEEKRTFRVDILNNVVDAINIIIGGMDKLKIPYEVIFYYRLNFNKLNVFTFIERLFIQCLGFTNPKLHSPSTC